MDSQWLRVFVGLEELGTLKAISDVTGYSTSAVSQHLSRLQHELGTTLVEPIGRRLALTPAGLAYLPHARAALQELEAGRGRLNIGARLTGVVRVAGNSTAISRHIAPAVRRLQDMHTGSEIRIEQSDSETVRRRIAEDAIDIGVVESHSLSQARRQGVPYSRVPLELALALGETRSADEVIVDPDTVWIGDSRSSSEDELITRLTEATGVPPRIHHHIDSAHLGAELIGQGYGVGLLASDTDRHPQVRYLDLRGRAGSRLFFTLTRPGREHWPLNAAIVREIRSFGTVHQEA